MKGLIIIPTYNDFEKIPLILSQIQMDVLVVNDGSRRPLEPYLKGKPNTSHLSYSKNKGKGYALRQGFRYAIKNKYEYVITMDADGEHEPSDLLRFQQAIKSCDCVIGQRKEYRSVLRTLLNVIGNLSFGVLLPDVKDTQCGFRAFRTSMLKTLNLQTNGFEIETELLLEAYMQKASISLVNIKTKKQRASGVRLRDYIQINDFFDQWVLRKRRELKISFIKKTFLMGLVGVGVLTSFIIRGLIMKWTRQ